MLGRFLLLLHELAHEVAQKLSAGAVTGLCGSRELIFQGLIDLKGKGCFTHIVALMCYKMSASWHTNCKLGSDNNGRSSRHGVGLFEVLHDALHSFSRIKMPLMLTIEWE